MRNEELEMKVAASPPFLEDGILVSSAFPSRGRLIKSPSHSFDKRGVNRLTCVV